MKAFYLFVLALLVGLPIQQATAQDKKLVLRVADYLPAGHFISRYATQPWMDQVTKATNGQVQFEYYPAEQLGKAKDLLSLAQSGVADIVLSTPAYTSDKMPLTAALELPGLFTTSCQGIQTHSKLAKDGGFLAEREYAPNGVRVLFPVVLPPYRLISAKRKIDGLKDIDGMKLRVLAGAMESTLNKLKAVGVRMSAPELYQALSRGTLDGVIFSYNGAITYNLLTKYVETGESFGAAAAIFIISENRWKQLPDSVKKAMLDAGEAITGSACAGMDKEEAEALEKLKEKGAVVVRWSAADRKEVDTVLGSVANEWAAGLDKRGKPGSEALKAILGARGGQ